MPYITPYQYYENGGDLPEDANWGSYQYTSLADIINNFLLMYVGNDKQLNNVKRHEIIFHAKQAIKMLNFDALRSIKTVEMNVGNSHESLNWLKFILPSDYVNYVRISINVDGVLRPLYENKKANSAKGYLQDNNDRILFDVNGEVMIGTSSLDLTRRTMQQYSGLGPYNNQWGWYIDDIWYFGYRVGPKYGMNPEDLYVGPTFRINNGAIDFSSDVEGCLVVLEYISDGMENGNDAEVMVNKMAEEFVYRYIKWALLNAKYGIPVYDRKLARDEKQAEFRNAKIRLSNMHPSRLLMTLRGRGKWIK
jgi:hypothetical protein